MSLLGELRPIACRIAEREFVRRHGGLYLLTTLPSEEEDFDFNTSVAANPLALADELLAGDAEQLLAGKELVRIENSGRNHLSAQATVGRALNNDVVIRHPSVSKLHAYFELPRDFAPETASSLRLVDAGSANGTEVNGRALPADAPVVVQTGARLVFGDVDGELLDAAELYQLIRDVYPTPELFRRR